jgi:hypothetical protein
MEFKEINCSSKVSNTMNSEASEKIAKRDFKYFPEQQYNKGNLNNRDK